MYWADRQYNQPKQPVVGVSWYDAKKFAEWAGLQLPSESQWEYACRAGTTTRYFTGDSQADLDQAGWYAGNSGDKLHPVGGKEPNAFGLYDMHGNVWEWCEDQWHESYEGAPKDGSAWVDREKGADRVFRGGAWCIIAVICRSAYRDWDRPDNRDDGLGFRLVRLPGQPGEPGK
jgi:formylglycine-generating enzyme required for sulfatase activity